MPRPSLRRDRRTLSERWGREPGEAREDPMRYFPEWRVDMDREGPRVAEHETNLRHDDPEAWVRRTRAARAQNPGRQEEKPEAEDDGLDRLTFSALRERAEVMGIDYSGKTRQRLTAEMRGKMNGRP